ncbi:unnamed protein product [Toxocara canis]|uniref:MaoC-like domain-containing protein n=1 Tax=Toxocara canis TaxID=6265 RepID=A0A183VA45_TOXCA|nr:unnamed protein product [Toxocara canis]
MGKIFSHCPTDPANGRREGSTKLVYAIISGIKFDLTRILHGEQFIEMFMPMPTEGKLRSEVKVVDILDKGSGALILSDVTTFDAVSGEKIARQQFAAFQLGAGNFGGSRKSEYEVPSVDPPQRSPDLCVEQKTTPDQAALYRLGSGDLNPLHVDPQFAQMAGFDKPILHGLCSLGFSVRHILKAFANNDVTLFKAVKVRLFYSFHYLYIFVVNVLMCHICVFNSHLLNTTFKARFSNPVIPGQTLCTQMWKEGSRIHFETLVCYLCFALICWSVFCLNCQLIACSKRSTVTSQRGSLHKEAIGLKDKVSF